MKKRILLVLKEEFADWEAAYLSSQIAPLVLQCVEKGRVLGGICDAASFLGTLGVLNTVKHTCNDLKDMEAWAKDAYTGRALHQKKQAVRDQNIVTANGTAALEFAREILFALDIADEKSIMDSYAFFKNGLYKE